LSFPLSCDLIFNKAFVQIIQNYINRNLNYQKIAYTFRFIENLWYKTGQISKILLERLIISSAKDMRSFWGLVGFQKGDELKIKFK